MKFFTKQHRIQDDFSICHSRIFPEIIIPIKKIYRLISVELRLKDSRTSVINWHSLRIFHLCLPSPSTAVIICIFSATVFSVVYLSTFVNCTLHSCVCFCLKRQWLLFVSQISHTWIIALRRLKLCAIIFFLSVLLIPMKINYCTYIISTAWCFEWTRKIAHIIL